MSAGRPAARAVAPLLTETARYWASRCRLDAAGRAHIDGVIGPDEYHERVDDNAFTNGMARWNLRAGADPWPGRCAGGNAGGASWLPAGRRLRPRDRTYEQFAGSSTWSRC